MKRRTLLAGASAVAFAPSGFAAQATETPLRVGWVTAQTAASLAPFIVALRAGFAEMGYVEGRNLFIDFRYGDDSIDRIPDIVAELQRARIDVILAQGAAVPVISRLAVNVPVAYVFSGDPVSAGIAQSLARPGSNMTGLTFMAAELNGKRLEMLRQIVPNLKDVAIIANPEHPGSESERAYSNDAASQLGLKVSYFATRTPEELEARLVSMAASRAQAVAVFADGFAVANRRRIIDFASARKLPVISGWPVFADSGAVCSYGPRLADCYRRLASYVDRIVKGAKPAELPIERPTTFELVFNLKAARALGVSIPQPLLLRADRVIA
jgi:putative ABC transport system substrate-binding protein